jgi:hypothetical protein
VVPLVCQGDTPTPQALVCRPLRAMNGSVALSIQLAFEMRDAHRDVRLRHGQQRAGLAPRGRRQCSCVLLQHCAVAQAVTGGGLMSMPTLLAVHVGTCQPLAQAAALLASSSWCMLPVPPEPSPEAMCAGGRNITSSCEQDVSYAVHRTPSAVHCCIKESCAAHNSMTTMHEASSAQAPGAGHASMHWSRSVFHCFISMRHFISDLAEAGL